MTPNAAITSAAAPNKVDKRKTCAWRADNDGVWHANCGNLYVFINGGPRDNNFRHCPYCARLIASATPNALGNGRAGIIGTSR